jgi:hypothetical protein
MGRADDEPVLPPIPDGEGSRGHLRWSREVPHLPVRIATSPEAIGMVVGGVTGVGISLILRPSTYEVGMIIALGMVGGKLLVRMGEGVLSRLSSRSSN